MPEKNLKNQEKTAKSLSNYAKYSGLAFQMAAMILVCVFGGIKLDQWLKLNFPVFTVVLSLLGTGAAMYHGMRDFLRKKEK